MLFLAGKIIEHNELNGRLSSKPCFDDTLGSVGSEVNPTALTGGTTMDHMAMAAPGHIVEV